MASYSEWLDGLTRHLFGPQFKGRPVRLVITRGVLDQQFGYLGGTHSFLAAMRKGPDWALGNRVDRSMHSIGVALYAQWTTPRRPNDPIPFEKLRDVPPYLPYLCLLCLAWTEDTDEDMAEHAYFARLDGLFPGHELTHGLRDWGKLWDGLAAWTARLNGSWGEFKVERLGGMPYVGIPKSQVIFTPGKIERMRDLFASLGLSPSTVINEEKMAHLLVIHDGATRQCMGNKLADEITRGTNLGEGAIKLLLEHLRFWDGSPSHRASRTTATTSAQPPAIPVLVVLEATKVENGWSLRFGLEDDKDCEALEFPDLQWKFKNIEPQLSLAVTASGALVEAGSYLADGSNLAFDGRWLDSESPFQPPRYEFRAKKAWFFDNWTANQRLVESRRITNQSGVYILLTPQAIVDWQRWLASRRQFVSAGNYTGSGLPRGFGLFWVTGLARLDEKQLAGLPGLDGGNIPQRRVLWMTGGTRVRNVASRNVYAEYDPPLVNLQGSPDISISADGAELKQITEGRPEGMRPGEIVRTYVVTVRPDSSVVIISASKNAEPVIQEISFAVDQNLDVKGEQQSSAHVDNLGDLFPGPGVLGAEAPSQMSGWHFLKCLCEPGEPPTSALFEKNSLKLLESLHVNGRRLTIQEYRRRALQISKVEYSRLYMETRWLTSLAHVDVQVDERGRWSHIHPIPRQMYLLPRLHAGRYQAVVCGCGTIDQLRRLIANAEGCGCVVALKESTAALIPPRILILHRDKSQLEKVAREHTITWIGYPAADAIATWSGDLDGWLSSPALRWIDRAAPEFLPEYVPALFQMSRTEKNHAPARLFWMEDPFSQRHFWHILERQPGPLDETGVVRHAFLRDPAWAKWKAHLAVADGDNTLVPFSPNELTVVVPRELHMPYLLGRALCLCSGLPPARTRFSVAYANTSVGVLPSEAPRYVGECWEYLDVPRSIAEKVAGKLGGQLKDIKFQPLKR